MKRFQIDDSGAVAPMFAMLIVCLLGITAIGLDVSRAYSSKEQMASAADAATVAAARAAADMLKADPQRDKDEIASLAQEIGAKFYKANLNKAGLKNVADPTVSVAYKDGAWEASTQFSAGMPTPLANLLGHNQFELQGKVSAAVGQARAALDIAMCVDSTGSMTPTLEAVKANALSFYDRLNDALKAKGIPPFPVVRVRMIYFKDFGDTTPGVWDPDPIRASTFFSLPSQAGAFSAFASPQMAGGGADAPESGIECLNEAMDSPWLKPGDVPAGDSEPVTDVYPLIVVWTDTASHSIGYPNSLANPAYPDASVMPRSYSDFKKKWEDPSVIDQSNKQILYFGDPEIYPVDGAGDKSSWPEIAKWDKFKVGGTLLDGNVSMIEVLAKGIASSAAGLRITN